MNGYQLEEPSKKPSVVSLFTGIGGLDLGFEWEGFEIIWTNDNFPPAIESYSLNFEGEMIPESILDYPIKSIPQADVIIGGPPCQSFSLVGKRNPDDERGYLVFKFVEVVSSIRPKAFVMENVPGMAASYVNEERLPDYLVKEFEKIGYKICKCKLMATDFLVPQKRARIFIIGSRVKEPVIPNPLHISKEFFNTTDVLNFDISAKSAIGDLGECVKRGDRAKYRDEITPSEFSALMRKGNESGVTLHDCPRMSETDKLLVAHIPPGGNYMDVPNEIATKRILKFKQTGGRTTTYGKLDPEKPAATINTYFRRPNVGQNFHYEKLRLITAREAMRLQSIPDRFDIVKCAIDKRNALIGNAVPPLLAGAVAHSVMDAICDSK